MDKLRLKTKVTLVMLFFSVIFMHQISAQKVETTYGGMEIWPSTPKVALKTNLLYDATATFNLGLEFKLSDRYTLEVSGNYNPWTFSENMKWKHWLAHTELRHWFCQEWNGHFVGIHAQGGVYNFGNIDNNIRFLGTNFGILKDRRIEGWAIGGGISYGYSWILSKHWNLEAQIGLGYMYTRSDIYDCVECGDLLESDKSHNYVGPTKAAINLIYVF